jgi:hypothetical protein
MERTRRDEKWKRSRRACKTDLQEFRRAAERAEQDSVKHTTEKKVEDKKSSVMNRESVEPDSIEKNLEDKRKLVVKKKNIEGRKELSD